MVTKLKNYIQDSVLELKKVNWLTRDEVVRYTVVVIFISIATAVFLGGLDYGFNQALIRYILKIQQ
jgi:preprotein translocase SecE subunit